MALAIVIGIFDYNTAIVIETMKKTIETTITSKHKLLVNVAMAFAKGRSDEQY
jgi:hypothetical protein